jgi:hypothetical protein
MYILASPGTGWLLPFFGWWFTGAF